MQPDQVGDVVQALDLAADALGTDSGEVLRILAPYLEPVDVAMLAPALDLCPHHLADREVCEDDRCVHLATYDALHA